MHLVRWWSGLHAVKRVERGEVPSPLETVPRAVRYGANRWSVDDRTTCWMPEAAGGSKYEVDVGYLSAARQEEEQVAYLVGSVMGTAYQEYLKVSPEVPAVRVWIIVWFLWDFDQMYEAGNNVGDPMIDFPEGKVQTLGMALYAGFLERLGEWGFGMTQPYALHLYL